ncbi:MAG TPA: hypothetical protein VFQ00_07300 [Terriglobales bacterium]|nr:hypothetical protein [Terriglobales bacterium]
MLVLLSLIGILPFSKSECFTGKDWFNQRVSWKFGKEGLPWKTIIKSPDRNAEYELTLRPLWALEGGVVALEVVLARPGKPDVNMLGERDNESQSPFVITVGELKNGLAHSKFGMVRRIEADGVVVTLKVQHFRLGRGLGSLSTYCASCRNLQELSMWITVESKPK